MTSLLPLPLPGLHYTRRYTSGIPFIVVVIDLVSMEERGGYWPTRTKTSQRFIGEYVIRARVG